MNENLYSTQMEQNVLCILMITSGVDEYVEKLDESDFYASRHAFIFRQIKKLHSEGKSYDIEVIADVIKRVTHEGLNEEYLKEILRDSTSSAHRIDAYIDVLKDHARRRTLFNAGEQIKRIASDIAQYDSIEAVAQSESVLASLETEKEDSSLKDAFSLSVDLFSKMAQFEIDRENGTEKIEGVSTGFQVLDDQIGTLKKGDLVYIGARPSMGKTAFSQDIILNAGFYQQLPVLFHSVEMPAEKIMKRMVASMADINLKDIGKNMIPKHKWGDFNKASLMLKESKIYIDDASSVGLHDIRRNCRKIKNEHGFVGLIVIDYLTLLTSPIKTEMMHQSIGAISKGLKRIAKEFECPVVCLSQLNRTLEKRPDKRPMLSDLRESGSVEEDGDVILFLYRDEYYNKNSQDAGTVEVIAAKVRDGEVGTVRLATELQYSRFSELAHYGDES